MVKPNWEKLRRRLMQAGTALILLAPIPFHIFLSIHEPGSFGILSYLLPALSFGAVALGVLLLLLGAACLLFIRHSAREAAKGKPALREETRLRMTLVVTVVAVLFAYALLTLVFLMLISGFPETSYNALAIPIAGILWLVVPFLYLLLFVSWVALLQRRRAIARAAPPDEPGQPEDGEK